MGGGFTKITTGLLAIDPALVFAPGPKEWLHPGMLLSFWGLWVWISVANPATVKRFLVFKDSASLHRALIVGSIVAAIFYIPMFYMGAGIKTIYPGIHPDQAIPNTYINALPGLIAGLALAAPFAAVMSTVDSLLLVMASALVRDVYQNYINKNASEKTLHGLTYGSTVGIGLLVLIFVYYPPDLIAKWIIYFGGGVTAAFLVPVLSALYWKRATTAGAICAIFGGFAVFVVLDNVAKNPFHVMSYVYGVLFALILMVVVSYLTKPQSKEVIELYFGPAKGEVSNS
jgi:sodium/pantothenate symporter